MAIIRHNRQFTQAQLSAAVGLSSINGTAVKKAMPSVSYKGVSGLIEFDEKGDAKRDVAYVKQVDNETGKWKFIAVQKVN